MSGIILLILSFLMVISSSYFITTAFQSKRGENSFIFWGLIVISQVILIFEALSLFKLITPWSFLLFNLVAFLLSFYLWNCKNRPFLDKKWIKNLTKSIQIALKNDKILLFLTIFFIFAFLVNLYLAIYAPINVWDAMSYQVARVGFWIQHGTLAHFETSSVRQVMFPPNSELLMLWVMLFIRKDFMLGMVQYLACFAGMFVIYSFLSYLKFSLRRILWAVLVFASLPAIIVHSTGTQNHIILGVLLITSLYLFIYGVFEKETKSIVFSAIALGISIGVKSSVFFFLPGMFIAYLLIAMKKQGKYFYKTAIQYVLYLIPAFILFSSYFYIMNFLEFGHPLGVKSYIYEHTHTGQGIAAFTANMIRYITVFFDFTGVDASLQSFLSFPANFARTILFNLLGLSPETGLTHPGDTGNNLILANVSTHENRAGLGPLGFLLILPLLIMSISKYVFSKSRRVFLIGICGFIFIAFILTISFMMGYEIWNNRYFTTAIVISAPILAMSYSTGNKTDFKKLFIFAICLFCFIKIPLFNQLRPVFPIKGYGLLTHNREDVRYSAGSIFDNIFREPITYLDKKAPDSSRIGLIFPDKFWYFQFFAQNPDWKIYPLNLEFLTDEKLKNLDYLVVYDKKQKIYSLKEDNRPGKEINIDYDRILKYFKRECVFETQLSRQKYRYAELGNNFKFYIFKRDSGF